MEKVDLAQVQFTPELLRRVPAGAARRFDILPVACHGGSLVVAFGEPQPDVGDIDEVFGALCSGESETRELQIVVADAWQLGYYIHKIYGHPDDHVD